MQPLTNRSAFRLMMSALAIYIAVPLVTQEVVAVVIRIIRMDAEFTSGIWRSVVSGGAAVMLLLLARRFLTPVLFRRELSVTEETRAAAMIEAALVSYALWSITGAGRSMMYVTSWEQIWANRWYMQIAISFVVLLSIAKWVSWRVRHSFPQETGIGEKLDTPSSLIASSAVIWTGVVSALVYGIAQSLGLPLAEAFQNLIDQSGSSQREWGYFVHLGALVLALVVFRWKGHVLVRRLATPEAGIGFIDAPKPWHIHRLIVFAAAGAVSIYLLPSMLASLRWVYMDGWGSINAYSRSFQLTSLGLFLLLMVAAVPLSRFLAWHFTRTPHHYCVRDREQQLLRHGLKLAGVFIFLQCMTWIRISEFFHVTYERSRLYVNVPADRGFADSHLHDILVSHTYPLSFFFIGMLLTLGASHIARLVARPRKDRSIPPPERRLDIYFQYVCLVVAIFIVFASLPEAIDITVSDWDHFWPWYGESGASATGLPWFVDGSIAGPAIDQVAPLLGKCILAIFLVFGWGFRRDIGASAQGGQ
jgi:hypothetical protein